MKQFLNSTKKRSSFVFFIILIFGLILWIKNKQENVFIPDPDLTVTIVLPQEKVIKKSINVTGSTVPQKEVIVATELSGIKVLEIYNDIGDFVKKGQKLALLDCSSLQSQLIEATNDYELTRDDYSRTEQLAKKGIVSTANAIKKQINMQSAKARLSHAQYTVKQCEIIAPETGFIFERKAIIGKLINSSEPLFRIASDSIVEIKVDVPEYELNQLKLNQQAKIKISGYSKEYSGMVRIINPKIKHHSRTATVRVSINDKPNLHIGLFADVSIKTGFIKGQVLPITSLQYDNSGSFVWRIDGKNKVVRQSIIVSDYTKNSFILQKIPRNSKIIARAGAFVKDGDLVNILDA